MTACGRCGGAGDDGHCPACHRAVGGDTAGLVPYAVWLARRMPAWPAPAVGPRRGGRGRAYAIAATWSTLYLLLMLAAAGHMAGLAREHHIEDGLRHPMMSGSPPMPAYGRLTLAPGLVCWALCTAAELLLAHRHAAEYPLLGPLQWIRAADLGRRVRRVASRVDRATTVRGGGCLAIPALTLAGPALVLGLTLLDTHAVVVWAVVLLATTAAYLATWRRRAARPHRQGAGDG